MLVWDILHIGGHKYLLYTNIKTVAFGHFKIDVDDWGIWKKIKFHFQWHQTCFLTSHLFWRYPVGRTAKKKKIHSYRLLFRRFCPLGSNTYEISILKTARSVIGYTELVRWVALSQSLCDVGWISRESGLRESNCSPRLIPPIAPILKGLSS